jgi:hypothetical protein
MKCICIYIMNSCMHSHMYVSTGPEFSVLNLLPCVSLSHFAARLIGLRSPINEVETGVQSLIFRNNRQRHERETPKIYLTFALLIRR